jgi:WD40 repeat protein
MQEIDHTANPFPGLRPFESSETHLFFGRDGQSEELLRRLRRTRFLAVVGTSGSGKSSLVRAGMLPALQGGLMASAGSDWRIAILRPGGDPIGNLARALASPAVLGARDDKGEDMQAVMAETTLRRSSLGLVELVSRARTKLDDTGQPQFPDYENLLVVVDQFEELFRFKQLIEEENSKEDAAAFVKLLLEAVGDKNEKKIYVVLTMRSDFLGDCSQFFELPEAINNGQYLIPRMTRDERREAISGPVAVGQGTISEPLVNQLLNDVGDNPDQLPILQHALMRTWDHWLGHRNGEPIDIPDYNAIGGMAEALSRHADEAYAELDDSQKAIAEKLFKGLTEKGTDNREIRRPMEVQEICALTGADEAAVIAVVEVFRREGRSFLMPPPTDALTGAPVHLNRESLIDISHESLIRNWERLKTWVDEESRSARIYRRLAETAVLHKEGGAGLWRDPDLGVALTWREQSNPNHVWARRYHPEFPLAMSFLDESVSARDAQIAGEDARRRKEIKRTRLTALIFAVAFLFSLAMGVYAYSQKNKAQGALWEAKNQQSIAEREKANTERVAAQATIDRDKAIDAERNADRQSRIAVIARGEADTRAKEARTSAKAAERAQQISEAAKNEAKDRETEALAAAQQAIKQVGENRRLLYSSNIGVAQKRVEDKNDERAQTLLTDFLYDPSKEFHITVSNKVLKDDTGDLRGFEWYYLWGLANRKRAELKFAPIALPRAGRIVTPVAVSSNGVATSDGNGVGMVWVSQEEPAKLPADHEPVTAVALGPSRSTFAYAGRSSVETRWWGYSRASRLSLGEVDHQIKLKGDSDRTVLSFSPDGKYLAVGNGGTFILWDYESDQETILAQGSEGSPSVHFIEEGKTLITCDGRRFKRWDVETRRSSEIELLRSNDYKPFIKSVAFTADGKVMVTAEDNLFTVWAVEKADPTKYSSTLEWRAHREPKDTSSDSNYDLKVAISPNGKLLATGDGRDVKNGGGVKLWDLTSKRLKEPLTLGPNVEYPTSLAFSDDSRTLIIGGRQAVQVWEVGEKALFQPLLNAGSVKTLLSTPDGKRLLTVSGNEAALWSSDKLGTNDYRSTDTKVDLGQSLEDPVAISSNNILATRKEDTLKLWNSDFDESNLRATIKGNVQGKAAFSPDGETIATASAVDVVEWWNTDKDQSRPSRSTPNPSHVAAIAFSPDGKILAVGGGSSEAKSGIVTLWNATTPKHELLKVLESHVGVQVEVTSLAFSPDGQTLVTGGSDKTVELWSTSPGVEFGKLIHTLEGHQFPVMAVTYSPDGKTIASGDNGGIVNVWNASSHQWLLTLNSHPDTVHSVAFMNTLTSDDLDLNAADTAIRSIGFSANGNILYISDKIGNIRLWRAIPREQIDLVQKTSSVAPLFGPNNRRQVGANGSHYASPSRPFTRLPNNLIRLE